MAASPSTAAGRTAEQEAQSPRERSCLDVKGQELRW